MQTIDTLLDPVRLFFHTHHWHIYLALGCAMMFFFAVMYYQLDKKERK